MEKCWSIKKTKNHAKPVLFTSSANWSVLFVVHGTRRSCIHYWWHVGIHFIGPAFMHSLYNAGTGWWMLWVFWWNIALIVIKKIAMCINWCLWVLTHKKQSLLHTWLQQKISAIYYSCISNWFQEVYFHLAMVIIRPISIDHNACGLFIACKWKRQAFTIHS